MQAAKRPSAMPAGDQQAALNEQARAAAERNALNERIHSLEGQLQQAQHRSAQLRAQHADLLAQADAAVQRAVGRAAAVHGRMQLKMDMAGQASGRIHVLSWRRAAGLNWLGCRKPSCGCQALFVSCQTRCEVDLSLSAQDKGVQHVEDDTSGRAAMHQQPQRCTSSRTTWLNRENVL